VKGRLLSSSSEWTPSTDRQTRLTDSRVETPGATIVFAAKAGAKHVYAIEASGLAMKARANIRNNGLEGVITVHQGKIEDLELGIGKEVDVVVSEWMVSLSRLGR